MKSDVPIDYVEPAASMGDVSVFNYCLPLVYCATKLGPTIAENVKKSLTHVGLTAKDAQRHDGIAYITSDKGSENKPAMKCLFNSLFVFIHCAAHALNLVWSWSCEALPGTRKSTERMSHRWVAWAEKLCNLLRRKWSSFSVYSRVHSKWPVNFPKPPRGVRTRWLSIIYEFEWIMPKVQMLRIIIRKYYLKGNDGKFSQAFQQAWLILHNKEFLQCGAFILVWGDEFFLDALQWIEGKHGFRAPEMPQKVNAWRSRVEEICGNYEAYFGTLIEHPEYGMGKERCKQWVRSFGDKMQSKIGAALPTA